MGQLTDRCCRNVPAGSSHKLLTLKSFLWRHRTKSCHHLRQRHFDRSSFGCSYVHTTSCSYGPALTFSVSKGHLTLLVSAWAVTAGQPLSWLKSVRGDAEMVGGGWEVGFLREAQPNWLPQGWVGIAGVSPGSLLPMGTIHSGPWRLSVLLSSPPLCQGCFGAVLPDAC